MDNTESTIDGMKIWLVEGRKGLTIKITMAITAIITTTTKTIKMTIMVTISIVYTVAGRAKVKGSFPR